MGQTNNHKSNFHFLILGCKSFAVNYSLKSGTHGHHRQFHFNSIVAVYRAKKMRIVSMSQYLRTWLYISHKFPTIAFRQQLWVSAADTLYGCILFTCLSWHLADTKIFIGTLKAPVETHGQRRPPAAPRTGGTGAGLSNWNSLKLKMIAFKSLLISLLFGISMGYSAEEIITEIERRAASHSAPPEKGNRGALLYEETMRNNRNCLPIPTESAALLTIVAAWLSAHMKRASPRLGTEVLCSVWSAVMSFSGRFYPKQLIRLSRRQSPPPAQSNVGLRALLKGPRAV